MWQLLGPQAVCVTENSWRPSLAAGERPSGPYPGSVYRSQWLSPRAGAEQYRNPLNNVWVSAPPPLFNRLKQFVRPQSHFWKKRKTSVKFWFMDVRMIRLPSRLYIPCLVENGVILSEWG